MYPYPDEFNNASRRGSGVNAPLDNKGRTALHVAVANNDKAGLVKLIRIGAKLDQPDNSGQSAVFEAIALKRLDLVEMLAQKGASLNLADDAKRTPLDWAIEQNCDRDFIARLRHLGARQDPAPDTKRTPLHLAAEKGRPDLIEYFVASGADINAQDASGRTPLFAAIEARRLGCAEKLLDLGADALRRNTDIRTPLHAAAAAGYREGAELLLKQPEVRRTVNEFQTYSRGFTPLMEAVDGNHADIAELIVAAGGDVNARDHQKRNSLYIAVEQGHLDAAERMIRAGADVEKGAGAGYNQQHLVHAIGQNNFRPMLALLFSAGVDLDARNAGGQTALNLACENVDKDKVRALLELGADPDAVNSYGRRPIDAVMDHYGYAYGYGMASGTHDEIIGLLLKSGADPNLSPNPAMPAAPLHIAARHGKTDTLRMLVQRHARIDQPDRSRAGQTPLMAALENGQLEAAKFLKENGADMQRTDAFRRGILHYAARGGNKEIIEALLALPNAQVDVPDGRARTPLHHACKKDKVEAAALLLKNGADPKALDFEGFTPLHRAVETNYNPDVLETFKEALGDKADWNLAAKNGDTLLHIAAKNGQNMSVEKLLEYGADPSKEGAHGLLPLHLAILQNNDWVTGQLLDGMKKRGVPADKHRDKNGWSVLHYAVTRDEAGHAEKIIEAGADVNLKALNGDTPLHVAVRAGKDQLVALLLSKGAEVLSPNADGETPLDTAAKLKREYAARLILEEMQKRPPLVSKPAPAQPPRPPMP